MPRRVLYCATLFGAIACAELFGGAAQQSRLGQSQPSLFSKIGWVQNSTPAPIERQSPHSQGEFPAALQREPVIEQPAVITNPAPTGNLALADLETMALAANPSLAEAESRVQAAQGRWLQSGLGPNPSIGYSGQQLGSGGIAEQHGLVLAKTFVRGGKLDLNRAVECEEIHRQYAAWVMQHQRVITDVRLAYYQVLASQQRLALARKLAGINEQAMRAAESLLQANEGSKVDVLQAQIELEAVTATLHQAEFEAAAAWRKLATIVGRPDLAPQALQGDLETDGQAISFEDAWQVLQTASPEIQLAQIAVEKASRNVRRQQVESVPDINVEAILQHDNATDDLNGNLQITFPLRTVNRNQGGIQEAVAQLSEARQALERKQLELRDKLSDAFALYQTARDQVEHYRQAILPKAAENLELVRQGYQAGEFSFVQVLTVQRTFAEKNSVYLSALRELWMRRLEIEGQLLKDSLSDF